MRRFRAPLLQTWQTAGAAFADIESRFDTAALRVDSISLWPIIRTTIRFGLSPLVRSRLGPISSRVVNVIERTKSQVGIGQSRTACDVEGISGSELLFLIYKASYEDLDGAKWHPVADLWRRKARARGLNLATFAFDGAPGTDPSNASPEDPKTIAPFGIERDLPIRELFGNYAVSLDAVDTVFGKSDMRACLNALVDRFGQRAVNEPRLRRLAAKVHSAERSLRPILAAISPKLILVQCYYSVEGWAACAAARQLGIAIIDLQHGVQGPLHEAYTFERDANRKLTTLPSGFLTWDAGSTRHLSTWVDAGTPIIQGVPPRLVDDAGAPAIEDDSETAPKRIVLYLAHRAEDLAPIERVALQLASANSPIELAVRVHPSDRSRLHRDNPQGRSGIAQFAAINVRRVVAVATAASSAVLEWSAKGYPALVTHPFGQALLEHAVAPELCLFEPLSQHALLRLAERAQSIPRQNIDLHGEFDQRATAAVEQIADLVLRH